jgi:thiol:disulfide interchange protein DsbD
MESSLKKFGFVLFLATVLLNKVIGQIQNPVHWSYGLKKLSGNVFEVHILARIDSGWHIYAQKQSPDAVAVPTHLTLEKVPGLTIIGKPVELGKKEKYTLAEVGITNMEYANKVDFVQKVVLKPGLKEIKGRISWQACTHKMCLQEQSLSLTVPVN